MNGPTLLADYLKESGKSQKAFAAAVDSSEGAVSLWLSGSRTPGGETAFAIERETKGKVPASIWFGSRKKPRHARRVARRPQ